MTELRLLDIIRRYIPDETNQIVSEISSNAGRIITDFKYDDLTPEIFEKIYFKLEDSAKLLLIPASFIKNTNYENDPIKSLITENIARDILLIDIRTICHIPKNFISNEYAKKAMDTDITLIQYVPSEYQTTDYQKKAIDARPENISLIDEKALTDEVIYYALNKKKGLLGSIPKERRTREIVDYAVSNHGCSLRYAPSEFVDSQLCFKAVSNEPSAITQVPFEILTEEFMNSLTAAGIVIPNLMKCQSYISECLSVHKKLDDRHARFESSLVVPPEDDLKSECFNTRLESLEGLFTASTLKLLSEYNIFTVRDLLSISNNSDFYLEILNNPKEAYREIRGAIRLLKCKYMNIDPMMYPTESENLYSDIDDFCEEVGFSSRIPYILRRSGISPKKLCEMIKSPNALDQIYKLRNVGKVVAQELVFKITILVNYYDSKKKNEEAATEDEIIEALNQELTLIREEMQRLNTRTDEIILEIKERLEKRNKGGAS